MTGGRSAHCECLPSVLSLLKSKPERPKQQLESVVLQSRLTLIYVDMGSVDRVSGGEGSPAAWEETVRAKRQQQQDAIPREWIITTPISSDLSNVLSIPGSCGLLSAKEQVITATDTPILLGNLAQGTWSSVEVTTAFCKRAVIAHQLVSPGNPNRSQCFQLLTIYP